MNFTPPWGDRSSIQQHVPVYTHIAKSSDCIHHQWHYKWLHWWWIQWQPASHPNTPISTPHWWDPIRVKQLSVALPSFVTDGYGGNDWFLVSRVKQMYPGCSALSQCSRQIQGNTHYVPVITQRITLPCLLHITVWTVKYTVCIWTLSKCFYHWFHFTKPLLLRVQSLLYTLSG